jgi:hypothetical protein
VDEIDTLQPYWPTGSQGAVLITTRDPVLAKQFGQDCIDLPLFTDDESCQFMVDLNPHTDRTDRAELAAIKSISRRLGCLPVVLHSIGAYTCSTSSSYRSFSRHYDDFDRKLIFEDGTTPLDYDKGMRTTWTMMLEMIDPAAKYLMERLVLFDAEDVPLDLFESTETDKKYRFLRRRTVETDANLQSGCIMGLVKSILNLTNVWRTNLLADSRKLLRLLESMFLTPKNRHGYRRVVSRLFDNTKL